MLNQDNFLEGKIALVTGASRGIGKCIAQHLAILGLTVVGTATTQEGAAAISKNLQSLGKHTSFGVVLNTNDLISIESSLQQIHEMAGDPLILINNAGITRDNLLIRMHESEWEQVISTNLTGTFRLTKACLRSMIKARWGRVINISSIVAFSGNIGQANYTATKAGIIGFTKSLALEVANRNITANVIAPGFIDTDLTQALPDAIKQGLLAKIPAGRLGTVEDIANAVDFLISESASYITGNTLHINGGMLMS